MKAISRNEKYLSKLSGEEEVVPKPISREEKYMYRACGYIDKPIPEHAISREEKYWKKIIENGGGGSAVLTSKDITENGLYNAADDEADGYSSVNVDVPNTYLLSDEGKVVSDGALVSQTSSTVSQNGVVDTTLIDSINVNVPNINNILFAPPQKFKSNGSNLLDYKIYGNNTPHNYSAEGTLPLTFSTHTAGNASDWEIRGNDEPGTVNLFDGIQQGSWGAGNFIKENSNTRCRSSNALDITGGQKYTVHCETTGNVSGKVLFQFKTNTGSSVGESGWLDFGINGNNTVTAPATATKTTMLFGLQNDRPCNPSDFTNIMLVKGSTAPDHYIPYQQGVGERTVNLLKITAETQTVNHVQITINTDKTVTVNGTASGNIYFNLSTISFPPGTYTLSSGGVGITSDGMAVIYAYDETYHICNPNDKTWTLSEAKNVSFVVWISSGKTVDNLTFKPMFVKGSTAPTTYIPYGYEIPISVSGENVYNSSLIDAENPNSFLSSNGTITAANGWNITTYIPIFALSATVKDISGSGSAVCCYDADKNFIRGVRYVSEQSSATINTSDASYVRFSVHNVQVSTAKLYPVNDYTFYIGDTPLTAGQSISKTSTGVDIATQAGSNTISTDLYNKPSMSIEGVDYVGVGEPINDSWQIPVKINSTTTNVPIDAPLIENEYVSYIDQKIYHYIDGTLAPVDPPSTLPHIATANGVNELSIDVEVQPELVGIGLGNPIELVNT